MIIEDERNEVSTLYFHSIFVTLENGRTEEKVLCHFDGRVSPYLIGAFTCPTSANYLQVGRQPLH